jgi:hypothetical protein
MFLPWLSGPMARTVADRAASVPVGVGPAGLPSMAPSIAMIPPTLVFQTMSPFTVPSGTSLDSHFKRDTEVCGECLDGGAVAEALPRR